MKKELLTLAVVTALSAGLAACGDDKRISSSTQVETIEPAAAPVTVENTEVRRDSYGNTHTTVRESQAYVAPVAAKKTTTTVVREDD